MRQTNRTCCLALMAFAAFGVGTTRYARAGASGSATVTIVLVGDSTVALEGGWGSAFCASASPQVKCIDDARNGRSSKSFRDDGGWAKALKERGSYYLIQFGHNDEKPDTARHTDPDTTYASQLRQYVDDVRSAGAIPIIISPLSRRNYLAGKLSNPMLSQYAAVAARVAQQEKVAFIDLFSQSTLLLSSMTQEQADEFDAVDHPDEKAENRGATKDRTHLNDKGKAVFGQMVLSALLQLRPELRMDFRSYQNLQPSRN